MTTYGVYPEPCRRVGQHYEKKGTAVTKYYFAGSTRLAVRTNGTLSFLLGDHLGSSSVTANASGVKTASALYKAFAETRYSSGALGTDYKFTGQREQAELGLYFYGARWFDPSIGRFTSPDTIVPTQTQGTQAWDRYAYVNNNPVRYTDPTGHRCISDHDEECQNDDGSMGAGFTGQASASRGASSNDDKGCGGRGQERCNGGKEPISWLAFGATFFDTFAFLFNAGYTIVGGLIVAVCLPCIAGYEGVYQLYSILPNTLSSVATALWFFEGIRTGQTSISFNLESLGTEDFSTTNIVSGSNISLSIDQDTAVSTATNTAGWTILRDPGAATLVDFGVMLYDIGRNTSLIPAANPTFSYSTNSGWSFSWFR